MGNADYNFVTNPTFIDMQNKLNLLTKSVNTTIKENLKLRKEYESFRDHLYKRLQILDLKYEQVEEECDRQIATIIESVNKVNDWIDNEQLFKAAKYDFCAGKLRKSL